MLTQNSNINFFQTNETILKLSALRLPKKEDGLLRRSLYYVFAFVLHLTCLVFFGLEVIKVKYTFKDATKFFSHIGLLFTHMVGILKAFLLIYRRGKIEKVMDLLQKPNFEASKGFQPELMLVKAKRNSSNLAILIFCLYSLAGILAYVSAWSSLLLQTGSQHFDGNVTCYDFLPFYFHIPFPVDTKSQCENAFTFMGIALCGFAWFIASHDSLFCSLLHCLKTQLEIVGQAMVTIRPRTLKKIVVPLRYGTLRDGDYPELEKALYRELKQCIKHLELLLQARDDIESIFTFITLAQTLSSILIISSCLFVATTSSKISLVSGGLNSTKHSTLTVALSLLITKTPMVPLTSPKFFSQGEYFFCILLQLWLICNFGNAISTSNSQIIFSLYESDWLSSSARYKKSMIMIMCRMQRPLYLSIGKFSPLTLVTFMAVCKGSFSYYTVFKSIK